MTDKRTLICIPCMDSMPIPTVASLLTMERVGPSRVTFLSNSLVYDARNMLAAEFLDDGADYCMWIDSDVTFRPDLMKRLIDNIGQGYDFVSGLYFRRVIPMVPMISKIVEIDGKKLLLPYRDYPKDQIFEVDACGFGGCIMSRKLLKDAFDTFGEPFYPQNGNGEDYSFCERVRSLGYKIYCDSNIKIGHIGAFVYGENEYLATNPQK